ncbi:hypothetical protein CEXT_425301 [Caerostris extrusa]|uniref:Secreted protein n=1 Tax=Caerostris extrusa TaxID=172846 RepID=A0AAV4UWU1_CAEEX|nr:hypothetical protein CEXT_425301 [Caerostris extrusa]
MEWHIRLSCCCCPLKRPPNPFFPHGPLTLFLFYLRTFSLFVSVTQFGAFHSRNVRDKLVRVGVYQIRSTYPSSMSLERKIVRSPYVCRPTTFVFVFKKKFRLFTRFFFPRINCD